MKPATPAVQILPANLANQIAAGEVVERPASVVKELVENAIDAEATRILIDIEGAGRTHIQIVDNGHGMSREDATRSVYRHATSKISSSDDLFAIGTLGFRGEALPSIASVSRFTLVTRREEDPVATVLTLEGESTPHIEDGAGPVGTRIEVRDLFWNVPARRKFLKSDRTETRHIIELVRSFALGYPQIHFRLGTGARQALDYPAVRRLADRVAQVLGKQSARDLFPVEAAIDADAGLTPLRLSGFASSPREAKASTSGIITFVNGRRVKDRTIHHAIVAAYGASISPGHFPQAILWLHVDPNDLDVNVHPTKAEVRFHKPHIVHAAIQQAIQAMLTQEPWRAVPLRPPKGQAPPQQDSLALSPTPPYAGRLQQFRDFSPPSPKKELAFRGPPRPSHARFQPVPDASRPPHPPSPAPRPTAGPGPTSPSPSPARPTAPPPVDAPLPQSSNGWRLEARTPHAWIASSPLGVVLFRPDRLRALRLEAALRHAPQPLPARPLLVPGRLDLSPQERQGLQEHADHLAEWGFRFESFGGATYQLTAVPTPLMKTDPVTVLHTLADTLSAPSRFEIDTLLKTLCARVAALPTQADDSLALLDTLPDALKAKDGVHFLSQNELTRLLD